MVDELAPNFDADDFVVAGDVVDVAEELVSHLCQIGTVVARVLRCGTDHGHAVDEALELVELLEHRQLVGVEERTSTVTRVIVSGVAGYSTEWSVVVANDADALQTPRLRSLRRPLTEDRRRS